MISIYKININDIPPCDYKAEYQLLSCSEKDRILANKNAIDQKQSIATKILLRKALKENFGLEDYILKRNKDGKPILDFCYVSFSHSNDLAVCAVSENPVGIDIEKIKSFKKRDKYHFFSEEESLYVNFSKIPEQAFFEVWTRKESLFKFMDINASELSSLSVISDSADYSFKTELFNGYIISYCFKK